MMDTMMRTHETAGVTAAAARVMALASMATRSASPIETTNAPSVAVGLGYGWQSVVASPCDHADFTQAITNNKRQPRRLGQRTT